jgi:hypothetical protein
MKTILTIAALFTATAAAFAQGQIVFNNSAASTGTPGGARVFDGGVPIAGNAARAALLAGPAATAVPASMTAMGNLEMGAYTVAPFQTWVNFRTGTSTSIGAGFVSVGSQVGRAFTTIGWNTPAIAQIAVWTGNYNTWSEAWTAAQAPGSTVKIGLSGVVNLTTAPSATATQPTLLGLQPFSIAIVPEPATASLLGLGLASLLIFRRRK